MDLSKGSVWRKWDLHIHSPLTILNNQFSKVSGTDEPDWDAYVTKLESLDIAVFGVIDYFTIEGYKKVKELQDGGRLNDIRILPNIEFRLNNVLASRKDGENPRRLNFHVIFSDEVSTQDIEEHFLHDIDFYFEGNPQDPDDKRKLKVSNLEELGKKLISQHEAFKDRGTPLEIGAMNAVVNHEDITRILCSNGRFKGKYILVFPEELSNLIDWDGQDHQIRKGLLQKSDMVFSSNLKTRQWCLGKEPYEQGEEKYIEEFKTLKPCIHGSDAHRLEDVGRPCNLRGDSSHNCDETPDDCVQMYCWIKADPTFEGLKQLLYEPDERVVIQPANPTTIKSNYSLGDFSISGAEINDELKIKETKVELNHNLIAVTGGKGGGKTAFVDLIANCYQNRIASDDKNSFVRRISDQSPEIETEITFLNSESFSKNINDLSFHEDSEIVYIAQGELEKYIGDDSDFDLYVKNLLFEGPDIKDSLKHFEFEKITKTINDCEINIESLNQQIEKIENLTNTEEEQRLELQEKKQEAEIRDLDLRIKEAEKGQSEENIKLAQNKQGQLSSLKEKRESLNRLKILIEESLTIINNGFSGLNDKLSTINTFLEFLSIDKKFGDVEYPQKDELTELYTSIDASILKIVSEIEKLQKEINGFNENIQLHTQLLGKKSESQSQLEEVKNSRNLLEERKKQLEQLVVSRRDFLKKIIDSMVEQKKKYEEIIEVFSAKKLEILSDLNFLAKLRFNKNKFIESAEDVIDNRHVKVRENSDNDSFFKELFALLENLITEGATADDIADEVERLNNELKTKIKKSSAITVGDLYKFLYSNYLSVTPEVKYKNIDLNKLSLGQKATVLIKIYLARGDKPIIIDSHDDHLDNEFIMEELVNAIREAKKYRQIFLVSNNGNVVINSDAEQLIIASVDNCEITYISGAIENPVIRDRAVKVLEGGPEAFRKRQQKYRLGQ